MSPARRACFIRVFGFLRLDIADTIEPQGRGMSKPGRRPLQKLHREYRKVHRRRRRNKTALPLETRRDAAQALMERVAQRLPQCYLEGSNVDKSF
jgi:hypothetical protein